MRSWIEILGTHTTDTTPSFVLHANSGQRYLFNCGEGTQRLCSEKTIRFSKMNDVFFTRMAWECVGGLPGMLLTLADSGTGEVRLHGGSNLSHFLAATRHFIMRPAMKLGVDEFLSTSNGTVIYKDENLTVEALFIEPTSVSHDDAVSTVFTSRKRSLDGSPRTNEHPNEEESRKIRQTILDRMFQNPSKMTAPGLCETTNPTESSVNQPRPSQMHLPPTRRSLTSVCYICQGPDIPGKFNPKAALDAGIRPGPDYKKLIAGESITAPDGVVVRPEDVLGPGRIGRKFVVLDVPSVDYIDAVVENERLNALMKSNEVTYVIHMLGEGILENGRYSSWMKRFSSETNHVVLAKEVIAPQIQFAASSKAQSQLAKLDSEIFPVPYYRNTPEKSLECLHFGQSVHVAVSNLVLNLEPKTGLSTSTVPPIFEHSKLPSPVQYMKAVKALHQTKEMNAPMHVQNDGALDSVVITTLGTGSAIPSKYRNVSGTMLTFPDGIAILDAGEGTLGQLFRHVGVQGWSGNILLPYSTEDCLRKIKLIFVSHLHADHHLGIIRILRERHLLFQHNSEGDGRVFIVGPLHFYIWLKEYNDVEAIGFDRIEFINAHDLRYYKPADREHSKITAMLDALKLKAVATTEVIHCIWSYALGLEHQDGWKLIYSGDTRPCEKILSLVDGHPDVLIHEATFEDDMAEEAEAKRHSTTSEAINVGHRMHAKSILLNHFSQRYPRIPKFNDEKNLTGISFDMMSVRLSDIQKLVRYAPVIRKLFQTIEEEEMASEDSGKR